ncbi:MAG: hypothetical protein PVF73_02160 [Bacteroidales bacterium]|jgi:hypothetical protein
MSKSLEKLISSVSQVITSLEAYSRIPDQGKISGPYSLYMITERLKEIRLRLKILSVISESDRPREERDLTGSGSNKSFGDFSLN